MNEIYIYIILGFEHISDWRGFDHILFIVTLCSIFTWQHWKNVALLVTAFTLGHTLTLALAAFKLIVFNTSIIELLIAVTILITAIVNIWISRMPHKQNYKLHYLFAVVFGCVHGMGFSIFFSSLMMEGMDLLIPLFSFNIGLEFGQLIIVIVYFFISFLIQKYSNISKNSWTLIMSVIAGSMALAMVLHRFTALQ